MSEDKLRDHKEVKTQSETDYFSRGNSLEDTDRTEEQPNTEETIAINQPEENGSSIDQTFENYTIQGLIAKGGMGAVYKARHRTLGRTVALKVIRPDARISNEAIERFQAEAIAAAALEHPGIVPLYETGVSRGRPFIAMAFVDGESLFNRIKERPLSPLEAARIIELVSRAVAHAHERGIVHRDIKPQNILLTKDNSPLLTDFGLAKQTHSTDNNLTIDGQVLGTPSYMPPEQASGKKDSISPTSDVYAIGATLYCALTGRPPFVAPNITEILSEVIFRDPIPPSKLTRGIPRDLETICLKCLSKSPTHRYKSASNLADDLERFRLHRPILARRITFIERAFRWARRNPFASLTILMITALLIALPWYYFSIPGYLKLQIEPSDAKLIINGIEQQHVNGAIDFASIPGRYHIQIHKTGYRPYEKTVHLVRGPSNSIYEAVTLEPLTGYIRVISTPPNANLTVQDLSGKELDSGVTPYNSTLLPSGKLKLKLSKTLFKSVEFFAEVPSGGKLTVLTSPKLVPEFEYSESYDNFVKRVTRMEKTIKGKWDFREAPLRFALRQIEQMEELPIIANPKELSQHGVSMDEPVGFTIENVSLQKAFLLILKPLRLEIRPTLQNDKLVLFIGPKEQNLETVVFPVADIALIPNNSPNQKTNTVTTDFSRLQWQIETNVSPDSWQSSGGPATLTIDRKSASLIVKQTWNNLVEIDALIRSLKQSNLKP